ncbi:MAG: redox-sensing transcriptional repressor Rex [Verrucomicrobiota bacterium]|nr:redox-sensing transcriptional repressor Rex [Verrucomicrobiota bacterium]
MKSKIPRPTVCRLCMVSRLLEKLHLQGRESISSTELGKLSDISPYTVRKDFSFLGDLKVLNRCYDIVFLNNIIRRRLQLEGEKLVCVVGLGRIGSAILNYDSFLSHGYKIVLGFDSSINRVETIKTDISVYPAYEIEERVHFLSIDFAILAVPASAAQEVAQRLINGGVKGILNFSQSIIKTEVDGIVIQNIDLVNELDFIRARLN